MEENNSLNDMISPDWGSQMHLFASKMFPICRSLTGNGVRETLKIIKGLIPELKIHEVPTGTKVFDWEVPNEWNIRDAYILNSNGKKIVDFKKNNLHVMSYSTPINTEMDLEELNKHLYSRPDLPEAIPYVTSFYKKAWGFCISEVQRRSLKEGKYKVVIDSELAPGSLTYGEVILPGASKKEIFFSTYVCHPSMGNNEISGPTVTSFLAKYVKSLKNQKYTYRLIFIPETIGSITYLSKNLNHLKNQMVAGYNLSCVGDNRQFSFIPSRNGKELSDKIALHVLNNHVDSFVSYPFLESGSDERRYCSPGVDLPVSSVLRTRYGDYPEYHTSLDDLTVVTKEGLQGAFSIYSKIIRVLEKNENYKINTLCEPQLGKRGLYPSTSTGGKDIWCEVKNLINFISYADGQNDLVDIADILNVSAVELFQIIDELSKNDLLGIKQ
ncbi:DUF4910 domain-containing protein [Bacteriovoracales bacterium]|nr:DUF4910 domain-containing protein [Bacteriovoracales bacterium]